jgi:hypothetical protein
MICTQNTIADTLGSLGCNVYNLLVVDLLHEFELGIFKSVFKHLLRLLYAINPSIVSTLNDRWVCFVLVSCLVFLRTTHLQ